MSREYRQLMLEAKAAPDADLEEKRGGKGMIRGGSGQVGLRLQGMLANTRGPGGNFYNGKKKGRVRTRAQAAGLMNKLKNRRGVAAYIGRSLGVGTSAVRQGRWT